MKRSRPRAFAFIAVLVVGAAIAVLTLLALDSSGLTAVKQARVDVTNDASSAALAGLVRAEAYARQAATTSADFDRLLDSDDDCVGDGVPTYPGEGSIAFRGHVWQRSAFGSGGYLTRFVDDNDDALTGPGYARTTQVKCNEGDAARDQPAGDRNRAVFVDVIGFAPGNDPARASVTTERRKLIAAAVVPQSYVVVGGRFTGELETCSYHADVQLGDGPTGGYASGAALLTAGGNVASVGRASSCSAPVAETKYVSAIMLPIAATIRVAVNWNNSGRPDECGFLVGRVLGGDLSVALWTPVTYWGGVELRDCRAPDASVPFVGHPCWFPLMSSHDGAVFSFPAPPLADGLSHPQELATNTGTNQWTLRSDDARLGSCRGPTTHSARGATADNGLGFDGATNTFTLDGGGVPGAYYFADNDATLAIVGSTDDDDLAKAAQWPPITIVAKKRLTISVRGAGHGRVGVGSPQQLASIIVLGDLLVTGPISVAGNIIVQGDAHFAGDTRTYGNVHVAGNVIVDGRLFANYPDSMPLQPEAVASVPYVLVTP